MPRKISNKSRAERGIVATRAGYGGGQLPPGPGDGGGEPGEPGEPNVNTQWMSENGAMLLAAKYTERGQPNPSDPYDYSDSTWYRGTMMKDHGLTVVTQSEGWVYAPTANYNVPTWLFGEEIARESVTAPSAQSVSADLLEYSYLAFFTRSGECRKARVYTFAGQTYRLTVSYAVAPFNRSVFENERVVQTWEADSTGWQEVDLGSWHIVSDTGCKLTVHTWATNPTETTRTGTWRNVGAQTDPPTGQFIQQRVGFGTSNRHPGKFTFHHNQIGGSSWASDFASLKPGDRVTFDNYDTDWIIERVLDKPSSNIIDFDATPCRSRVHIGSPSDNLTIAIGQIYSLTFHFTTTGSLQYLQSGESYDTIFYNWASSAGPGSTFKVDGVETGSGYKMFGIDLQMYPGLGDQGWELL